VRLVWLEREQLVERKLTTTINLATTKNNVFTKIPPRPTHRRRLFAHVQRCSRADLQAVREDDDA
jgi:hypothetical protein